MTRTFALVACSVLLSCPGFAQTMPAEKHAANAPASAAPDRSMLVTVLNAWASMNPENPKKYYDQAPSAVFYDIAPLKYTGFSQYEAGTKSMFATLKSLEFTLNDDAVVHHEGNMAWSTATVKAALTDKAGKTETLDCRWTAIWQKKGAKWIIAHDHFSAPLPETAPQPAADRN